ncbi:hypothetical protein CIG1485E_0298 [Campylobacter iguaniorum]|uniref:Uncharacterized protein n=1 Tax=Campylobacter iguaniorum TaxID=1244531 RepID=A0A076FE92_9BACT|nr:hypothetical protein [Campylobacter iguaniorum]AII14169.1 hypothetical protein CIG1485E_0298 [Campylobacter iguaniorum]
MRKIFVLISVCGAFFGGDLKLDFVSGDGLNLMINSKNYLALEKPCAGWKTGDEIEIIDGDKNAKCLEAVVLNLKTKTTCRLLCDAK